MRYHGFSTRDYLILDNIPVSKEISVMEIGVGTGSTADLIVGKVKKYCGVDISAGLIEWLKTAYKYDDSVKFYAKDATQDDFLGEKFDVIFSADTLEHVSSPKGYFNFIEKHLTQNGIALVTFPNESPKRHHGILWFNSKSELIEIIDSSGLKVLDIYRVEETAYHKLIKKYLWSIPKRIISRHLYELPQSFENTEAFEINKSGSIKKNIFACYAKMITWIAALLPLYDLTEVGEDINDKVLLFHLKHKYSDMLAEENRRVI